MFELVDQVLESGVCKNPAKAVLIALVKHINHGRYTEGKDTEVWAGTRRLMHLSGCSESTVHRSINKLVVAGIVQILSVGDGKKTSHYTINLAKLGVASENTPAKPKDDGVGSETTQGSQSEYPGGSEGIPRVVRESTLGIQRGYHNQEVSKKENQKGKKERAKAIAEADTNTAPALACADTLPSEDKTDPQLLALHRILKPGCDASDYQGIGFGDVDPLTVAHVMVWAYRQSNYSDRLNGIKSFAKAYPQIAASYEKYQSQLSLGKPRPEEAIPSVEGVLRYAESTGKYGTPAPHKYAQAMKVRNGNPELVGHPIHAVNPKTEVPPSPPCAKHARVACAECLLDAWADGEPDPFSGIEMNPATPVHSLDIEEL